MKAKVEHDGQEVEINGTVDHIRKRMIIMTFQGELQKVAKSQAVINASKICGVSISTVWRFIDEN